MPLQGPRIVPPMKTPPPAPIRRRSARRWWPSGAQSRRKDRTGRCRSAPPLRAGRGDAFPSLQVGKDTACSTQRDHRRHHPPTVMWIHPEPDLALPRGRSCGGHDAWRCHEPPPPPEGSRRTPSRASLWSQQKAPMRHSHNPRRVPKHPPGGSIGSLQLPTDRCPLEAGKP